MTDRVTNDLAALLTPPPSRGVQFSQAKVLEWDNELLSNALDWRGVTIRDVPMVEGINALTIRENDVVGLLGWAPENAQGVGSWWILGKLSNPGEFVGDLNITAKIFRLVTEDEHTLAFFGKESDGDPLWILSYGGADEQSAIRLVNANQLTFSYRDGQAFLRTSGASGEQIFQMFDNAGNELVSTDAASDVGLARPWIPYLIQPTVNAQQLGTTFLPATTSASFTPIWRGFNPLFHPRIAWGVVLSFTGTPEWRLRVHNGTGLVNIATGSGSAAGTDPVPGWGTVTQPGANREIVLEARNTGGGTTHIGIDRLYGTQS